MSLSKLEPDPAEVDSVSASQTFQDRKLPAFGQRPQSAGNLGDRWRSFLSIASLVLVATLFAELATLPGANAAFTTTTNNGTNAWSADTLDPPSLLSATGGGNITLNWTASVDTYASGHRIFRATSSGGPYTQIVEVTPRTTTSYVDSPIAGTYYYVVRAFSSGWESLDGNEAAATVSTVSLADSWQAGLTHVAGSGSDRMLVFVASNEQQSASTPTLTSVSFGGQPLTRALTEQVANGCCAARLEVWLLDEAGGCGCVRLWYLSQLDERPEHPSLLPRDL